MTNPTRINYVGQVQYPGGRLENVELFVDRRPNAVFPETLTNSATPSVRAGRLFVTGGTTTITNFTDGIVGQEIIIKAEHSVTITDNATIVLSGGANYAMTDSDTLTLVMFDNGVWQEVSRSVN